MSTNKPPQEFIVDDLSDVIDLLGNGIYRVTRNVSAGYADGVRLAPVTSTFNTRAVVWPVSGRSLDRLPEGLRTNETKSVVTNDPLQTATPTNEPDTINIEGVEWQVEASDRWTASGNFYRALVQRVTKL